MSQSLFRTQFCTLARTMELVKSAAKKSVSNLPSQFVRWFFTNLRTLWETRPDQILSLDGLRTIAITIVIASHSKNDFIHAGGLPEPASLFWLAGYAWIGVDLFFVLSGFLIGRILMQEIKSTGTVQIMPFLIKRGFRIWPLYYFICAISLFKITYQQGMPATSSFLPDLLFLTNYFHETLAFGSWSLSLEEQFYLIAAVLLFATRRWLIGTGHKLMSFLIGALLLAPFIRMHTWNSYRGTMSDFDLEWSILHNFIQTHYDGLAMGLLIANIVVFSPKSSSIREQFPKVLGWAIVGSAIMTSFFRVHFLYSLVSLTFGAAVWQCINMPTHPFSRALSWPGFQVVSRLSYGMYLWYRFPLWKISDVVVKGFPGLWPWAQYTLIFALAFLFAICAAMVTYVLIERPFLELRSRQFKKKPEVVAA